MCAGKAGGTGANEGEGVESGTIRIGTPGTHTAAYLAGLVGPVPNQATVLIDTTTGKLGYAVSSRRFKEQIEPIGDSARRLQALRPVSFVYKPEFDAGARELQYGLIAEEVDDVMPSWSRATPTAGRRPCAITCWRRSSSPRSSGSNGNARPRTTGSRVRSRSWRGCAPSSKR